MTTQPITRRTALPTRDPGHPDGLARPGDDDPGHRPVTDLADLTAADRAELTAEEQAELQAWWRQDFGMATAEYAIATLAACGFAGLLLIILRSDEVRSALTGIITRALSMA